MARSHDLFSLTGLTGLRSLRHPLIQAPMAGVSTPALAAAVSDAGALGSIAVGAGTAEQARQAIAATRALTDKPFNVNVFCHRAATADPTREAAWLAHLRPWFDEFGGTLPAALHEIYKSFNDDAEMLAVLVQARPAVVSFHFGLPGASALAALRDAGIATLACATTPAEARQIEAAGVDAVVAQGVEAGGHRGMFDPVTSDRGLGTLELVRAIAATAGVPVVAAGGLMDGADIAKAMAAGASAVQLGTAFILCPESAANAAYREALQGPRSHDTRITSVISGRPARGLANRFHTEVDVPGCPPVPDYPTAYDAGKALTAAAAAGGQDGFAVQWAGQGAPRARALPAAELVAALVREWHAAQ